MSPSAIKAAKAIHKKHGKSYFFATAFFPPRIRQAVFVLYAFFRVPDDLVDEASSPTQADALLTDWEKTWWQVYAAPEAFAHEPLLQAAASIFQQYKIPKDYAESFLAAMRQDIHVTRYQNLDALKQYMYGSAAVVGLILTHVIGCDPKGLPYAKTLGEAMQLTNFLRDIKEDLHKRNRIYLPQDMMSKHGVTESDLRESRLTPGFHALMQELINQTEAWYAHAEQGIHYLHPDGQRAVRVALVLYREIGRKIIKADHNVFGPRIHTSTAEKIHLLLKSYL